MRQRLVLIMIICAVSLSATALSVYQRQQQQYRAGVAGEQQGDFMVALTGYESAIRMYLPFSDTVRHSAERIWALGQAAEQRREIELALIAYRSLRSAFYAVAWLQQPGQDWIDRCDTKIAALAPLRKGNKP